MPNGMMWIHLHRFADTKDYSFGRILQQKEALVHDKCIIKIRNEEEVKLNSLIFPKVMHGKNILNKYCLPISYKDERGCYADEDKASDRDRKF